MANLVQVAEELEYVPKDQLIQMSQNPDSRYPQYLVLSEIQRRTQMEKMYNAQEAAMNQPQMTVADEVVSEYAQPQQGLAGMNAGGSGNTDVFSPPAMPASPMQQMASGGRTGYQNTGRTAYSTYSGPNARRELLASLNIDPTGMSEDEIAQAIIYSQTQQRTQQPLPAVDTGLNRPVDLTEVSSPSVPSVDTPEEDSWLDRAGSWARERYTDEGEGLGSVDWSNVLMDASWAIPGTAALKGLALAGKAGVGAIRSGAALEATKRGLTATAEGAKKAGSTTARYANPSVSPLLTRPNPKIVRGQGFTMRDPSVSARIPSATRLGITGTGLVGANMAYNYMTDDEIAVSKSNEQEVVKTTQDKLNELLADINKRQDTGTAEKKGLASFLPQAEGLDIAQLGGIIMGARNMSELGAGIAGLAGSIQDRRMKEKLSGIQGDLYKAQTDKYRSDIKNMEPNQLASMIETYQKLIEDERESMEGNPGVIAEYQNRIDAAYRRWTELMGVPYTPLKESEREGYNSALEKAAVN
jgi:hypothetical protein